MRWRTLTSRLVFQTPYFRLRQDTCQRPDGARIDDYYVMEMPDVAVIVALTPEREVLLVEQYKHGYGDVLLEIPGGLVDADDADSLTAAQRELREETGYAAARLQPLGALINDPTRRNNRVHGFLALDAQPVGEQHLDANEEISVRRVPYDEIPGLIARGEIQTVDAVAFLMRAREFLD